jgi:tRNA pseudouridine55 synthase
MDGLLLIDKPAGCTSHDVVLQLRRILGERRIGHAGTLDPDATGLLLVLVGRATRFFPFLAGEEKTYTGVIRLGFATDTYDASGHPTTAEAGALPSAEDVDAAMRRFEGEILQVPPPYSAKKIQGKPMYKLARAGRPVEPQPVPIRVLAFTLRDWTPPLAAFEARCSSGTYVRSLAHDLGRALGCGAHLRSLRRTAVGPFPIAEAHEIAGVEAAAGEGRAEALLVPLESLLPGTPSVTLRPEAVSWAASGSPLSAVHLEPGSAAPLEDAEAPLVRILDPAGKLVGLAKPMPERAGLHPFLVLRR